MIQAGADLIRAKELLGYGGFGAGLDAEFGMSHHGEEVVDETGPGSRHPPSLGPQGDEVRAAGWTAPGRLVDSAGISPAGPRRATDG
jgi:hypothetical protein